MAFGEEVGDAYIEVHADSRPFRRELRRDARRAGRDAGRDMGDEMGKGVDSELDETFSTIGARIRRSMSKSGFRAGQGFSDNMRLGVERSLKKWNLNLADALISGDFTKVAGEFESLDVAMKKIDDRLKSLRQGGRLTSTEFEEGRKSLKAWGDAIREGKVAEELDKAHLAALKTNQEMSKQESLLRQRELRKEVTRLVGSLKDQEAAYEQAHASAVQMNKKMVADYDKMHGLALRENDDIDRRASAHRKFTSEAVRDREDYFNQEIEGWLKSRRAQVAFERGVNSGMRALRNHFKKNPVIGDNAIDHDAWDRSLARLESRTDVVMGRIARRGGTGLLGGLRGARNNFVNMIGIIGGNIENFVGRGLDKAFDAVGGGVQRLGDKLTDLGGGSGPLAAVGNGLSTLGDKVMGLGKGGLDGLVVQIAIIIVSLQAFLMALGPLVAGLSGLIGIATALAVTIGGALLGAIGSLLPIVAALGIAAGAAVIGIMGMDDAMKDMLKPLEEWFDRVKKTVAANLFGNLQDQVGRLVGFLDSSLTPALEIAATSLSDFADDFLDMVNSPGVQESMRIFRDHLPGILGNLGRIFNGTFAAITGIISAAAPVVEDFLGLIADVAEEFANWANTDKGREEIRTFFEKAATAAETLFDIVGELGGIIGKLWEEGSDTGQKFLDSFENALEVFNDWLGTKEGRDQLSEWFEFAEDVASKLVEVVESLGELWKKLDTPQNRGIFLAMLGIISNLIDAFGWLVEKGEILWDILGKIASVVEDVVTWFQNLDDALDDFFNIDWEAVGNTITQPFEDAWTTISTWFTEKKEGVQQGMDDLFDIDWEAIGTTIRTGIVLALQNVLTALFGIGIQIVDFFILLPGRISEALVNLPTVLMTSFSLGWEAVTTYLGEKFEEIIIFVGTLPTRIAEALSTLGIVIASAFTTAWNTAYTTVVTIGSSIIAFVMSIPGSIGSALGSLAGIVGAAFSAAWNAAYGTVSRIGLQIVSFVMGIPARIGSALASLGQVIGGAFSRAWNQASTATQERISNLLRTISRIPSQAGQALGNLGRTLYNKGRELIQGLINGALSLIPRLGTEIASAILRIRLPNIAAPKISMPSIPKINWPWTATGGIFNGAQGRIIGEAGPEAVVPLNRPLSQVDPAVRALSAYAQGKNVNAGGGSGNTTNEITVVSPYSDPGLVALEVMDALTERAR